MLQIETLIVDWVTSNPMTAFIIGGVLLAKLVSTATGDDFFSGDGDSGGDGGD